MIRGCTNGSGGSDLSVREEAAAPQDNHLRTKQDGIAAAGLVAAVLDEDSNSKLWKADD